MNDRQRAFKTAQMDASNKQHPVFIYHRISNDKWYVYWGKKPLNDKDTELWEKVEAV